ncbi:phage tail protein [Candidatus Williamhamiltonella defendens]|nr:phage tail protein [Candidatus Hamiltonella defensa]AWK17089.1 phage tail protein [Candidatus Hamiltonella defensa]
MDCNRMVIMNSVNEETYYFGQRKLAWFAGSMKKDYIEAGSWDDKAKAVPYSVYREFALNPAPIGKTLGISEKGDPIWVDIPPKTKHQLITEAEDKKSGLMQGAREVISPLQDAIDLEMATQEETQKLTAWKRYRVLLNRLDTSNAPDIDWPKKP